MLSETAMFKDRGKVRGLQRPPRERPEERKQSQRSVVFGKPGQSDLEMKRSILGSPTADCCSRYNLELTVPSGTRWSLATLGEHCRRSTAGGSQAGVDQGEEGCREHRQKWVTAVASARAWG